MFKMSSKYVFLIYSTIFSIAFSNPVDFISVCKGLDRVCTTDQAKLGWPIVARGIPELGISSSDPFFISLVETNEAGLNLKFRNITVVGVKKCVVEDLFISLQQNKIEVDIICPFVATGQYLVSGRILVLPVEGEGDFTINLKKVRIQLNAETKNDKIKETGKSYLNIYKFTHHTTPIEPVTFKLNNLFNGNKELSDGVHSFINANYRDVLNEVGGPILETIYKKVIKNVKKLLRQLPLEEYFL